MKLESLRVSSALMVSPEDFVSPDEELVENSVRYLASQEALDCIKADPYWPKWNGPWWHMMLLYELGFVSRIPVNTIEHFIECFNQHYLQFFPFRLGEIPEGCDPVRHILCHCGLGSIHQLLHAYGVDVDQAIPWARPWYLKYQLEDGGLNCDEDVYTRKIRKSSLVSTMPPLEAVLFCTARDFTPEEMKFLDAGANYLIERKLLRTVTDNRLIDPSWLELAFPRFYYYDQLRGLTFVLNWALKLRRNLPLSAIVETLESIGGQFPKGRLTVQRQVWAGSSSRCFDEASAEWIKTDAKSFPLLDGVSIVGSSSYQLSKAWSQANSIVSLLAQEGLLLQ